MIKNYFPLLLFLYSGSFWAQIQKCAKNIAVSKYGTMTVFTQEGTLYTWGKNDKGQTGNGTTQDQSTPVLLSNTKNYDQLVHGQQFTLGLTKEGQIYSWGANDLGYLGNGTTASQLTPTLVDEATDWTQIDVGRLHSVAIKKNGSIWGWGNNAAYELTSQNLPVYQDNYYTSPTLLDTNANWKAIFAGSNATFGIKTDGTLWSRGRSNQGSLGIGYSGFVMQFTQVGTANDWKYISSSQSENFTFGLKNDGSLWAWGDNSQATLGNGTLTASLVPTQIGQAQWKDIAAGSFHAVGIQADGSLWHWGSYGWLNNVILIPRMLIPTRIGNQNNWVQVQAGYSISFALKADQTVWAWGYNSQGWFGNGTTVSAENPVLIFQCPSSSLHETDWSSLIIYPNPTTEKLYWAENLSMKFARVFDTAGKCVLESNTLSKGLEVLHLAQGKYILHLTDQEDKNYYTSFIKK